jgi:hypothetical protein
MPTQPYKLKDGTRISGVTTILSGVKLGGIEGLLHWANAEGLAGRNHREARDAAADAGTCAHLMVECEIHDTEFPAHNFPKEVIAKAEGAFMAYRTWASQTKLKALHTEMPLVSERYKFGGTLDAILVDGKLSLGDWKTSNSIYIDMLLQLAGYKILWTENFPDKPITGGYHLLRFSKQAHPDDPVSFTHHYWDQLNLAEEMFPLMVTLYEGSKRLRKML